MSDLPGGPAAPQPHDPDEQRPKAAGVPEPTPPSEPPAPETRPGASPAGGTAAGTPGDRQPGPYPGVFGGGPENGPDRPGPYRGAFGQPGGAPGASGQFGQGGAPGGYGPPDGGPGYAPQGGGFNQPGGNWAPQPGPYGYQPAPAGPPKQVKIASAIALGFGGFSLLLGLFAFTSAGAQMAEILMLDPNQEGVLIAGLLLSSVAYILPAVFVRKRRRWARIMLIVVASLGIAGGIASFPTGILGLALHGVLLAMMLQQPTKLWFLHR